MFTWDLTCYRGIDIQNIGLTLQQSGGLFNDPKGVVLPNPTFVEEVILEEIEVGFGRIVGGEELSIGWNAYGRLRDLVSDT